MSQQEITFAGQRHALPPGAVTGLIGDSNSGIGEALQACAPPVVAISYEFDLQDAATRMLADGQLEKLRRAGSAVLLASHDAALLHRVSDEVWWIDAGVVRQKGDPGEVLRAYAIHTAKRVRAEGDAAGAAQLTPTLRRGDGRAELLRIETLGAGGQPTSAWQSGEEVAIRVVVRFHAAVADPVVGIMIRTRIGMEVFGTNTELERVTLGPCADGDERTVTFRFACALCPNYYTLTAASHDPDGVWHDWAEDAVAFTVSDSRYTAGVANLRATVTLS